MHADDKAPPRVDATIDSAPIAPGPKGESWLPMALDFGPLLVFFLATKVIGMFAGTAAFMAAIAVAVVVSKWRLGKVSPMLWLSAILVLFFGALTLYFHDPAFIQLKPTIIYGFFALMLIGGWMGGRPLLRYLLQSAYSGLDETGWLKLSRNWGFFFAALGVANELMRMSLDFDTWLLVKVWGVTAASMLFAMANVPMLMKHGLELGDKQSGPTA
ncbi:inner membrane-spanning protein YciB [Sphingobium sp. B2D3C]|uniref:inner membrane-spanning protein YciB n=1 Tax=unclassified Sphingobium TaxID=2611147 RepID=UPI0039B4E8AE|nr:intracellular septation protein [Sphingobium sp. B12D2B]MCW2366497.1 intracellular septation protein [Sphingobium sp. B7D2B]MCW2369396.1 intracellular septation protein [Sphingobium sp. B11D3D]MCW2381899.1 intracellular septation protein [Sphingobium sp. B2D3B]MCW2397995.1 intracellular septation protein [Sphingobium sp. B2D3C]